MKSLKEKVESADKKSIEEKIDTIIKKTTEDKSGAFWHKDEVFSYMRKQTKIEGKLSGISVGVKDLFAIKDLTTTAGSKVLENFKSPYDSTLWKSLKDQGAILGGKLAMDEFAMGSFTNTSFLGKCSLPKDITRTAGGSSGGSAAAVASGIVDFSIGSDTGGSVRQPASFCGVVGYKPTYGGFSRFGMIPYASSLDQAGFFTKNIEDLDYLMSIDSLYQKDMKDMTHIGLSYKVEEKTKKIGYFKYMLDSLDISEDIKKAYIETILRFEKDGYSIIDISSEYIKYAAQIYYIIACSEASSNLAKYQGVFYGKKIVDEKQEYSSYYDAVANYRTNYIGEEAKKRIMLGSFILSSENFTSMYGKACKLRENLTQELTGYLSTLDFIVLPVAPTVAPKWNDIEKMTSAQIYLADCMTVPFSLAGLPALSMPWYINADNLDIGMQIVGKKGSDIDLIKSIKKIETTLGYNDKQRI